MVDYTENTQEDKSLDIEVYLTLSQTSPGFYMSAVQVFRKHS